jgi:hypothetical protein
LMAWGDVEGRGPSDRNWSGMFNRMDQPDVILGVMFGEKKLVLLLVNVGFLLRGIGLTLVHSGIADR